MFSGKCLCSRVVSPELDEQITVRAAAHEVDVLTRNAIPTPIHVATVLLDIFRAFRHRRMIHHAHRSSPRAF
jgi:hypothetical protein